MIKKTKQFKTFTATSMVVNYGVSANVKTTMDDVIVSVEQGQVYANYSDVPASQITIIPTSLLATFYLYENGSISITATDSADLTKMTEVVNTFILDLKK